MSSIYLIVAAVIAGALLPIQAGINGIVGIRLENAVWSTTLNFLVGTLALSLLLLVNHDLTGFRSGVLSLPPWTYIAGLLGALFVTITVYLAPRIGATNMLASVIAGQMIMAVVLDHFGLLGFPEHAATPTRLLGVAVLALGVALIKS